MISRAFGDYELKKYGLSIVPHVSVVDIDQGDKWVVIASDGVWDMVYDQEAYYIGVNAISAMDLCKKIVARAKDKHSEDNISCFVVGL